MMKARWLVLGMALMIAALGVLGATYNRQYFAAAHLRGGEITSDSDLTVADDASVGGQATLGGLQFNASSATVASDTFAVSDDYSLYVLTGTSSQTGVIPTGGSLYQVYWFLAGDDGTDNTFQFDDGTSMSIGSNYTCTEAQNDLKGLMCISADGDEWAALDSDN